MSFSSDRTKKSANDILFKTLLTDPGKRAKVLELLMQEGLVEDNENASYNYFSPRKFQSPLAKLQRTDSGRNKNKIRLESPSALARRRALEKQQSSASTDDTEKKVKSPPLVGKPLPFDQLLRGVVAYCEVRSNGQDRSAGIKTMMRAMGAIVCEQLNTGVTHIIFKDGLYSTFRKAQGLKVHLVSVLWLDAVRRYKFRVPEAKYRALGVDAYNQENETRICQEMQKEFDDVVQDEYRRISQVKGRKTQEFSNTNNFVTQRRKTTANISVLTTNDISAPSQDANLDEESMHNPDISVPSKYVCSTPALSESESCSSSEGPATLPEKHDNNIVPCSQTASQSFTHDKENCQHLPEVGEIEVEESVDNIAKYVRDSFELKKAKQIKSPPQYTKNRSRNTLSSSSNKSVLTEDESIHLHVTISDESNQHSSANKSKSFSKNAQSFLETENEAKEKQKLVFEKTVDETKDDSSEKEANSFYFMEKDGDQIFPTVKPIKTYKGKRSSVLSPQKLIFGRQNEKSNSVDSSESIDNLDLIQKNTSAAKNGKGRRTTILPPQKLTFDDTNNENDEKNVSANKKLKRRTLQQTNEENNLELIKKDVDEIINAAKNPRGRRATIFGPQKFIFEKTNEENSGEHSADKGAKKTRGGRTSMSLTVEKTDEEINKEESTEKGANENISAPKKQKGRRTILIPKTYDEIDSEESADKSGNYPPVNKNRRTTIFVPQKLMFEKTNEESASEDFATKKTRGRRVSMSVLSEKTNEEIDEEELTENVSPPKKPKGRRTMLIPQTNEEIDEEEFADKGKKYSRGRRTTMFIPQKLMFEKTDQDNIGEESSRNIAAKNPRGRRMSIVKTNEEIDKEESAEKETNENVSATKKPRGRRTTVFAPQKLMFEKTNEKVVSEESTDTVVRKPRRVTMSVPVAKTNEEIDEEDSIEKEVDDNVSATKKSRGRRTTMFVPQTNEELDNEDSEDIEKIDSAVKKSRRRRTTMFVPQTVITEETNEEIDKEESVDKGNNDSAVKKTRERRKTILPPQKLTFDESDDEMTKTESLSQEDNSSVVHRPEAAAEEIRKPRVRKLFNVDQQFVDESLFNWEKNSADNTPPKKVKFYAMLPDGFPKTLSYKARTKMSSGGKKMSKTIAKISSEKPKSIPARRSAQHLKFDGDDDAVNKPEEIQISVANNNKKLETNSGIDGIVAIASTSKVKPTIVQKKGTKSLRQSTRLTSFESTTSDSDDLTKSDLELGQNVSKPSRKSMRVTKTINYADMCKDSQGSIESSALCKIVQTKSKAVEVSENSNNDSDNSDATFVSANNNDVINSLSSTNCVIGRRKSKLLPKIATSIQEDVAKQEDGHNKTNDTFITCNSDEDVITTKKAKRKSEEMEGKIEETPNKKLASSFTSDSDTDDDSLSRRVKNKNAMKGRFKSASTAYESTSSDSSTPAPKRTTNKVILKSPRKPRNCSSVFKRPPGPPATPNNRKTIPRTPQTEPLRKTVPQTPQTEPSRRINKGTPSSAFNKPSRAAAVNLNTPKTATQLKTPQSESKVTSNRRSTLEFVQRPDKKTLEHIRLTQKAKNAGKTLGGIVCTRFVEEDVHLFQQIVHKLGGFTIEPAVSKRTTHLVAAAPSRTINFLRAIARGCWILKKEWLYKSLEEGKWLEEEDYEMTEFSPAVQKCRLEKQSFGPLYCMDIFKDCGTIFVSRTSNPRFTDMEELIQLCGGRVVRIVRDADIIVGERSRNNEKNAVSVTEKWVLDSITYNKKKSFKHFIMLSPPQL